MRILAATDFSTRSNRAIRQAGLLAQAQDAQLHLLHVVDDDQPEELVGMERREAERVLTEQMSSMSELRGVQCRPMVVTGDPFDGILQAAAEIRADLIVMGSHRKQLLLDIFVGTTIERVIRKGASPVLMVNNEAQRRYEKIVVPLDMSETSVECAPGRSVDRIDRQPARNAASCFLAARQRKNVFCRSRPGKHRRIRCERAPESNRRIGGVSGGERSRAVGDGLCASRRADLWRSSRAPSQRCVRIS